MKKSDASIQNVCLAAIRRHTFQPIAYHYTFIPDHPNFKYITAFFQYETGELPIAVVFIDASNWTLLTTRRIVVMIAGTHTTAPASHIDHTNADPFIKMGYSSWQLSTLRLKNGETFQYHIETKAPAMIMMNGLSTLGGLYNSSNTHG
jgi:hypothetical protein